MAKTFSNTLLALSAQNTNTGNIVLDALESEVSVYVTANATWGSGTVIVQESFDGGTTWVTSDAPGSWTAGVLNTFLGKVITHAPLIRLAIGTATTPNLSFQVKVASVRYAALSSFTFAANGSTVPFLISPAASVAGNTTTVNGDQEVKWFAQGTWGSGTIALQSSPDGTTWFNVDAGISANGAKMSKPVTDNLFRFTLTGATSPALSIWVVN